MPVQPDTDLTHYTAGALKLLIEEAGLSHTGAVEKEELKVLAKQALTILAGGGTRPSAPASEAEGGGEGAAPDPESEPAPEPEPEPLTEEELAFRAELRSHWTEVALRIQLEAMGQAEQVAAECTAEELVEAYAAALKADGAMTEEDRRWLRLTELPLEAQALRYVEAVSGQRLGTDMQTALKSGEALCSVANVLLAAAGFPALNIYVAAGPTDGERENTATESRARARQMENLSLYQARSLSSRRNLGSSRWGGVGWGWGGGWGGGGGG